MVRRFLNIVLPLLVIGWLAGAGWRMKQILSEKEALAIRQRLVPTLEGVQFVQNLPAPMLNNKTTVIILFDPDCEHCQYEATQIHQQQAAFANTSVYWLTTQPLNKARTFSHQFGLDTLSMMHVGALTREEAYQAFGPTGVPHIFIYGADKRLRKEYKGEVKVEALLKYL